jgi:hypothetical protein
MLVGAATRSDLLCDRSRSDAVFNSEQSEVNYPQDLVRTAGIRKSNFIPSDDGKLVVAATGEVTLAINYER